MARTVALRAQHAAAERLFDEIFDLIRAYRGDGDAYAMALKLARLTAILRTHFVMEDELLYPRIIASDHREAAVMARVFQSELGHLSDQFERFVERWSSSMAIAASIEQFEYEAGMLFAALRDRIRRENDELYPLADQIEQVRVSAPFPAAPPPPSWQSFAK